VHSLSRCSYSFNSSLPTKGLPFYKAWSISFKNLGPSVRHSWVQCFLVGQDPPPRYHNQVTTNRVGSGRLARGIRQVPAEITKLYASACYCSQCDITLAPGWQSGWKEPGCGPKTSGAKFKNLMTSGTTMLTPCVTMGRLIWGLGTRGKNFCEQRTHYLTFTLVTWRPLPAEWKLTQR
jgi:hypothetical protein